MQTAAWRFGVPLWLLLVLALGRSPARAAPPQKQVLVVYSTRRDAQIVAVGERELPRILGGVSGALDYYSEYIDQARFPDEAIRRRSVNSSAGSTRNVRFDAVIAVQDAALELVSGAEASCFPARQSSSSSSAARAALENATGLVAGLNFGDTLQFIDDLQPEVRQIFVVTGAAPADSEYETSARQQFQPFESRFAITYLSGLPTAELEARLASSRPTPPSITCWSIGDGDGENVHPLEYLERLAAVANSPVYSWVDSAMDQRCRRRQPQRSDACRLKALGRLALRVLSGESAGRIPVSHQI